MRLNMSIFFQQAVAVGTRARRLLYSFVLLVFFETCVLHLCFVRFGETMVIGYECTRSKPHPDPYLEGLSRLGLSAADCVAFEDSVNGISSAVSAGLYTFGVGEGSQERLKGVIGSGICVSDYLDTRLPKALGLGVDTE